MYYTIQCVQCEYFIFYAFRFVPLPAVTVYETYKTICQGVLYILFYIYTNILVVIYTIFTIYGTVLGIFGLSLHPSRYGELVLAVYRMQQNRL